jgi:predicted nucleic acid-binding protein
MTIYPDTSLLVSLLYGKDQQHAKAMRWFRANQSAQWLISAWTEFETVNSLRSLCLRSGGPSPEVAESLRRWFKHLFTQGPFFRERIEWNQVIVDAHQVSASFAARYKARSADTLHLAILEQINPDIFVSMDGNQVALAVRRGFNAVHV